ncbi:MAG: biosynthetic-type acetolactate synthase large subunit [Lachnospiraceae bacterium]|nr:biosynthetic-type acetolactate synthase large subunit [Lachnospiraceae bacterium]
MKLNGSQIIIECLKEQGVDTVFGYPGGTILNVYDELYKHPEIRHILTSHEQGASHAADGYARATGKVGVCLATSGPGATNLVTGIATAYMDSIPMVAITANVGCSLLGKDSFQEVDIAGVVMPITKHSFIVKDVTKLAETIRRAFTIARSGRPGPVLVDVPKDLTATVTDYEPAAVFDPELVDETTKNELYDAAEMICKASRPMIFVGGGCVRSGAQNEVRELAERIQAPVCDSLMGKGVFPGTHELYTGMLGMHGTKTANLAMSRCDLLIVLGARFSDRCAGNTALFAKQAKILQIDVDAAEVNKNVLVDASLVGDMKTVLQKLLPLLTEQTHEEWIEEVERSMKRYPLNYRKDSLTGPFVIEELYRVTDGDAIVCTDVGQHQMWAAQYYKYTSPRRLLTSGGLGTMGYGVGAALGAKCGCPDRVVVNIAGDGCFRMNMNEIVTATRNNIPIIEIVINNHVLGMVRQWQTLFYGQRYSNTILNDGLDICMVAKGMGAEAFRVTEKEELAPVLEKAIALNKPCVIECVIDCDDKVFPMVPAGKSNHEVFDETDLQNK